MTKRILLAFGTRPEAIKMCPLVQELKSMPNDFEVIVCVTGQHREMLDQVLRAFNVQPDYDLSIMKPKQTLFDITSNVLLSVREVLISERPDLVLVHGDTTTSFAVALACFYLHITIGHVEAGLRTWNLSSPWPEEFNRQMVDMVSNFHFAPTETARNNLLREGRRPESVYVTGNTGIDALRTTVREDYHHADLDWVGDSRLVLLTAHRRENLGEPMRQVFKAIRRVVEEREDIKVLYPIHLNPEIRETAQQVFDGCSRIKLVSPLDVIDFHNFLARSYLVITDSGGIQEEAPGLGKPVLVVRDTTERPEGIAAGTLKLVGTTEQSVYRSFSMLLDDSSLYDSMARANNPYGDGFASRKIACILADSTVVLPNSVYAV